MRIKLVVLISYYCHMVVNYIWFKTFAILLVLNFKFTRTWFIFSFQAILGGTIQVPTLTGDVVLKVGQYVNIDDHALSLFWI